MAKSLHNDVLDATLNEFAEATTLTLCSAEPTTRTEAITTYKLADVTVTPGAGNGDFTIADYAGGRRLTIAQQDNVDVDTSGTPTHVALCDGTRLLGVTTCTSQAVVSGNTVQINAFNLNSADPT